MLTGPPSAKKLVSDYGGRTLHRRTVNAIGYRLDCHFRISDRNLGSPSFASSDYLTLLGSELGQGDPDTFAVFMVALINSATGRNPSALERTCTLHEFPSDHLTYRVLSQTPLFQRLRLMMS